MPSVPIRIVPASPALPALAMSTLLEPVVRFLPAFRPIATLAEPVALSRALMPVATLLEPVVLASSALGRWRRCCCRWCWRTAPRCRWRRCVPVVLENSAPVPVATFRMPVVLRRSASLPVATFRRRSCWRAAPGAGGDVRTAGRVGGQRRRCRVATLLMPVRVGVQRAGAGGDVVVAGGVRASASCRWRRCRSRWCCRSACAVRHCRWPC